MSIVKEFKEFAMRGNVFDLAVGVVIGGAFGKIVSSLVADVIMPPLNLITAKSGANFKDLSLKYSQVFGSQIELPKMVDGKPAVDADKNPILVLSDPEILRYGPFLQTVLDFLIIAFAIFLVVKAMNTLKKKQDAAPVEPPPTPEDVLLLREIRDAMVKSTPRRVD